MHRSNDSCCDEITWIKPHLLVFVDDYNVKTLDPVKRTVKRTAGLSEFAVSPNGRWIAGYADSGGHAAETVAVVPTGGGEWEAVPQRPDQDDSSPIFTCDSRSLTLLRRDIR